MQDTRKIGKATKRLTKAMFRLCGLDIRRVPAFEPYEWLKGRNIQTVFDIGANVGQFASQIHRVLPDAMLYSFEPLEDCYNELLKKMGHLPKFRAFNFALGDRNGQAQIYRNDYTPSSSLLPMEDLHKQAFPFTDHATLEKIEVRRLDDVVRDLEINDNVLIKIDVQGFEDKVILGGEKLLSRASVLIVETTFEPMYKDQLLFDAIYALLRQRAFVYMGTEHIIRNPNDGSILQCDSVFCKAAERSQ
jgi:FkbM family methyltransferase